MAGELQPTRRDRGGRENHTLQDRNPGGGRGRRPLGLGGARPTRMRGAESTGQPERERKEGYPGLDTLRKQEANEGSSARSTRVDPGASQTGLGVLKTLAQV